MVAKNEREKIDLVLAGAGGLLPCHVGAWDGLERLANVDVVRVGGTSAGAIIAACIAHGFTPTETRDIVTRFLGGNFLDPQFWFFSGWGIHRWRKMRARLREVFPGQMGEAHIPWVAYVTDLETQEPLALRSTDPKHCTLYTADVLASTSAVPALVTVQKIDGLDGLFVDGGVSVNFGMSTFDDVPLRRTIGVRFHDTPRRRAVKNTQQWASTVIGSLARAASKTYVSRKRYADVIEVKSAGDSMDFSLTADEMRSREAEGFKAVGDWLRARNSAPAPLPLPPLTR